jgi:hypothetical protein
LAQAKYESGGSCLPPLVKPTERRLSSAWLTATLLAATALLPTLFLALALLAFTFLSLAFFLSSIALLPRSTRFARFVWIVLSFHITFRCYITNFSLIFFAVRN